MAASIEPSLGRALAEASSEPLLCVCLPVLISFGGGLELVEFGMTVKEVAQLAWDFHRERAGWWDTSGDRASKW